MLHKPFLEQSIEKGFLLLAGIALFSCPLTASAKNFALILNGASKHNGSGKHDFMAATAAASVCLKSAGYQLRTLAGPENRGRESNDSFADNAITYPEDYGFFEKQKIPISSATQENLVDQLEGLVRDVSEEKEKNPGADVQVEIVVNAHGTQMCTSEPAPVLGSKKFPIALRETECFHEIMIFSGDSLIKVDSRIFHSYVSRLKEAGAQVNLSLNSCFAGNAKKYFDKVPGTCTFYGSASNSSATGCVSGLEEDVKAEAWKSNTTISMFRSCSGRFDELMQEKYGGYFAKNGCVQGLKKHIEKEKLDLSSMSGAYFSERAHSTSSESPLLSCFDMDLASKPAYSQEIQSRSQINCEKANLTIETLLANATDALLMEAWADYIRQIEIYNDNIDKQYKIFPLDGIESSLSEEQALKLAVLQREGEIISQNLIAAERALFQRYYQLKPEAFAACNKESCAITSAFHKEKTR